MVHYFLDTAVVRYSDLAFTNCSLSDYELVERIMIAQNPTGLNNYPVEFYFPCTLASIHRQIKNTNVGVLYRVRMCNLSHFLLVLISDKAVCTIICN